MITVGMNYQIREGKREVFEQVFNKVIQIMSGLDGHVTTELYTKTSDRNAYLIISEWNDRDAFDAFIASEQFRNVANWGKEEVLATQPSHQIYGGADTEASASSKPPETARSTKGCPFAAS
jgi:chlorite dismutase